MRRDGRNGHGKDSFLCIFKLYATRGFSIDGEMGTAYLLGSVTILLHQNYHPLVAGVSGSNVSALAHLRKTMSSLQN